MSLARVIIAHRQKMGFTQEKLAEMVGVSPGAIAQIETGRIQRPRTKTLQAISEALKVSVTLLFREAGIIPSDEDMEREIADLNAAVPELAELFDTAREIYRDDPEKIRELVRFAKWLQEDIQRENQGLAKRRRNRP